MTYLAALLPAGPMTALERGHLARSRRRLATPDFYPRAIPVDHVRIQHRRMYMWASYLWQGYRENEHKRQARLAATATSSVR